MWIVACAVGAAVVLVGIVAAVLAGDEEIPRERAPERASLTPSLDDPWQAPPPDAAWLAPPPPPPPSGTTGLANCDEYMNLVDRYLACDQLPASVRDGMREATDQMRQLWADSASMTPDTRSMIDDACRQGAEILRDGAAAVGCAL